MLTRVLWLTAELSLLLAACAATAPTQLPPTAVPTREPPTSAPATGSDATWDKIQKAGKMVVGTSADYAPFEYYTPASSWTASTFRS